MIFNIIFCTLFLLFIFIIIFSVFRKNIQYWIFWDIFRCICKFFASRPDGTIHVIFCFVDHFEPGNRNARYNQQKARVDAWVQRYPALAGEHHDSDGNCPQHTFFFPPHYDSSDHLEKIVDLCRKGFGEVEMHLHHDRMPPWPDNDLTLEKKIKDCLSSFSRYEVFCLPNGRMTYGFIHGDWALGNSLKKGRHCGVNAELAILERTGCYADFTFPVSNEAQPKLANTFFYAQTECSRAKAYNIQPKPIEKGGQPVRNSLLLVQGIIGLRWKSRIHRFRPSIEQSNVDVSDWPFPQRIDYWVRKGVYIKGKPEWRFVKIHTHGAREEDRELLLGKGCDEMFSYLESNYNDGEKFKLHYVSAREMYNIIKAAEAGMAGNPGKYRNYEIPRYCYLP